MPDKEGVITPVEPGENDTPPTAEELTTQLAETKQQLADKEKEFTEATSADGFKNMRSTIKDLKNQVNTLKGTNTEDPADPPPNTEPKFDEAAIQNASEKATLRTLANLEKQKLLNKYSEDEQKVVGDFYETLTADKNLDPSEVALYVGAAERAAGFDTESAPTFRGNGAGPLQKTDAPSTMSAEGQQITKGFGNDPKAVADVTNQIKIV